MLHKLKPAAWMLVLLIAFTGMASIAWQHKPVEIKRDNHVQDTTPKKEKLHEDETIIEGDLDKAMEEVKKAQENLENQLQNKDWEKWHRDLEQSLEKLNSVNIQEQVAKAMKNLDWQKVQMETQSAMQKLNWEKMQQQMLKVQEEMKKNEYLNIDINVEKAMEQTKKALEKLKTFDAKEIQQQMEKATMHLQQNEGRMKEDIERAKRDISSHLKKDFKKDLEKAQEGVTRAQEELQQYKNMLTEMDKDGLLKSAEDYTIKYKNGELFINGAKQPDEVLNKYKHYFKKDKVTIKRENGDDEKTIHL